MPLFAMIPSAATAAALIYVGVLMMKNNVKSVDFGNAINATTAFLTIVVMVLSYSITKGIGIGMLSYTIMSAVAYLVELIKFKLSKNAEADAPKWNVSVVALIVTALFVVYFFVPTVV
jgi:AGZA family xanthine/uracil permease-like MFS transporter